MLAESEIMKTSTTIRDERLRKNWTQQDLAYEAGISVQVINKIERGRPISRGSLSLVCRALGIDPKNVVGVTLAIRAGRMTRKRTTEN